MENSFTDSCIYPSDVIIICNLKLKKILSIRSTYYFKIVRFGSKRARVANDQGIKHRQLGSKAELDRPIFHFLMSSSRLRPISYWAD